MVRSEINIKTEDGKTPLSYMYETVTTQLSPVEMAASLEELDALFIRLSEDADGLTDADLALLEVNKEILETSLDTYFEDIADSISGLESVFDSLMDTVDKLRDAATDSDTGLEEYYIALAETQRLAITDDYEAYSEAVDEMISASDALFDSSLFTSGVAQDYEQLVAAINMEELAAITLEELDYLRLIEENTRSTLVVTTEVAGGVPTSTVVPMAQGGLVMGPTNALIGEAGYPEMVVPLKNPDDPMNSEEILKELRGMREELNDIRQLNVRQTATADRQLNTQRAMLDVAS